MGHLVSDGNAIDVTLVRTAVKGEPGVADGFFGIQMDNGDSGEEIAMEISLREHEVSIPTNLTPVKGDVLYITTAGVITSSAGGNKAFMKCTCAAWTSGASKYVQGVLLPQA